MVGAGAGGRRGALAGRRAGGGLRGAGRSAAAALDEEAPRTVTGAGVMLLALVVGLTAGTIILEKSKREAEENFRITETRCKSSW